MKTIALFTTTRAEFSIFAPLISAIEQSSLDFSYLLFVGGTHLVDDYGATVNEIESEQVDITGRFDYLLKADDAYSLSKSLSVEAAQISNIFRSNEFDYVCVVGDRYELLPIIQTALLFTKPVIHIGGGATTIGVIDEQVRNMVTKASHLHFVTCKKHYEKLLSMGEDHSRIFNVGLLAIDEIAQMNFVPRTALCDQLGLQGDRPIVMLTYHPVTLDMTATHQLQIKNILAALDQYDFEVIITSPSAEVGRNAIRQVIHDWKNSHPKWHVFESLGRQKYRNIMKFSNFIIGNSSSGINEAPYLRVPTINVGDRQKGRIRHASVIDVDNDIQLIKKAIERTLSGEFSESIQNMEFFLGNGTAGQQIIRALNSVSINQEFLRKQ